MRYKGVNDYELLYLVGENNEEVYNSIYAKYKPLIHRMAKTLCENYKSALVEYDDLFQGIDGINPISGNTKTRKWKFNATNASNDVNATDATNASL